MSVETGFAAVAILIALLILRIPVAMALIAVSFGGVVSMLGLRQAIGILYSTPYDFVASWTLSAVPMFLLMGFVAFHTGLTGGLFDAAKLLLRRLPGGLAISSIVACSGFAAVSGSSLACAAAMGRIAIPEMVAAGYRPSIAAGSIAAGGTIGALIPPSILMILYGIFAETSITQVFLGGIVVGLATAVGYAAVILILSVGFPHLVPQKGDTGPRPGTGAVLRGVLPILVLIALVFGGLFGDLFSATEAGAVGAMGTIVIAAVTRRLTREAITRSLLETVTTTGSLFIIAVGAAMFTRVLGLSGLSGFLDSWVSGSDLSYLGLMLVIVLVYLALGTFMEPVGAMLVTLPVFLPILHSEGMSPVWFGVLVVKLLEIGMITPPVGLNVFVIKNVAQRYVTTAQVFLGVIPFLVADLVIVALMIAFPAVVMILVPA